MNVKVHEAKTNLSKLLTAVENGEQVTIMRNNTPVADIVPHTPKPKKKSILGWGIEGKSPEERARIEKWVEWMTSEEADRLVEADFFAED